MDNKQINKIKNDIYNFPKNHDIFTKHSFIEACFIFTCVYELSYMDLTSPVGFLQNTHIGNTQDFIRAAYRESLKDSYKFCNHNSSLNLEISNDEIKSALLEFERYPVFNHIRNLFEQTEINKFYIEAEDETHFAFISNKTNRSVDAELYSRWIDHSKPELETEKNYNIMGKIQEYMIAPKHLHGWTPTNRDTTTKYFDRVYKSALNKINNDYEEEGYDFGKFSSTQFEQVYAMLMAIGILDYNYYYSAKYLNSTQNNDFNKPIVIISKQELFDKILSKTHLNYETLSEIFKYLIYNPKLHENKITILQPIFECNNQVFYSPSILVFSMQHEKLLYQYRLENKNEQLITKIAHDHEQLMTSDLCDFIDKKSNFLYSTNVKIQNNDKILAEFDIILYDENSKKMLLCELKWFFTGDGEADHKKIDLKLRDTIHNRLSKEKIAKQYINQLKRELNIVDDNIDIMSCIISKNYSGSDFLADNLPVFDVFLFKALLNHCNFDLNNFFKRLKTNNYLPDMDEIGFVYDFTTLDYAGYKITCPLLAIKA